MLLVFENGIAQVLAVSVEREQDCLIMSLARAGEIAREDMFNNSALFNGTFSQAC